MVSPREVLGKELGTSFVVVLGRTASQEGKHKEVGVYVR